MAHIYNLNNIKNKTVGQGQYGTARWATKAEIARAYEQIPFTPEKWRNRLKQGSERKESDDTGQDPEQTLPQGIIVGCNSTGLGTLALIDAGDVHALMIGAAGVGKTAYWLYPNIEYACASGMSFVSTDTKGDVYRNYGSIAKDCSTCATRPVRTATICCISSTNIWTYTMKIPTF